MNPALIQQLQNVSLRAQQAGYGNKGTVYGQAASQLGMSVDKLRRLIKQAVVTKPRKKRNDTGATNLSLDDARMISGYIMETIRKSGQQLGTVGEVMDVLRANGVIDATRLDKQTGELVELSESAVARALTGYGLHPKQLMQPSPKISLASLHPNHLWQIDPSLGVLYYLPHKKGQALQVMDEKKFYKNKPGNIRKIEKERVWRYVITDHTSGWVYVHYVLGAESSKNISDAFISATQKRHPSDPVHGLPKMVMVDPGSANTSAVFNNLCRSLGVTVQVNEPGHPWAKGQVENANFLVERNFEHRLRFMEQPPTSVEEINQLGWAWMRWFNQTKKHSRTGETRYATWSRILPEQLVFAPDEQMMRELAVSQHEPRKVSPKLTIQFEGKTFSVRNIPSPHAEVGSRVFVTRNPWRDEESAQLIYTGENGREIIAIIESIQHDEWGFELDAAMVGKEYKSHADTRADKHRKQQERLVMGVDTDDEAVQARKAQKTPFGGNINPMLNIEQTDLVPFLPRHGTQSELSTPTIELPLMSITQLALKLRRQLGKRWKPEFMLWLQQRYSSGATEDDLPVITEQILSCEPTIMRVVSK